MLCLKSRPNTKIILFRNRLKHNLIAPSISDREVVGSSPAGCGQSRSNRGPVALCTLASGPELTQPSILSGSVNEYRLRLGMYKAGMCDAAR